MRRDGESTLQLDSNLPKFWRNSSLALDLPSNRKPDFSNCCQVKQVIDQVSTTIAAANTSNILADP